MASRIEMHEQREQDRVFPDLAFVIPSFNHPVSDQLEQIDSLFGDQAHVVIVIDDGSELNLGTNDSAANVVRHESNLGLAQSLIDGYKHALNTHAQIIIRADADGEYPLTTVSKAVEILKKKENAGVFVEFKRNIESNGIVDAAFHNIMGFLEGNFLIGQPMSQHSPGLQVYKREVVKAMLPVLETYVFQNKTKWGLDLLTIRLASEHGDVVPITLESHAWKERRPIKKILSQMAGAISVLVTDRTTGFHD